MYVLGERVNDIAYWKSELNMEIGAMENETNDLKVLTSLPAAKATSYPVPTFAEGPVSVLLLRASAPYLITMW